MTTKNCCYVCSKRAAPNLFSKMKFKYGRRHNKMNQSFKVLSGFTAITTATMAAEYNRSDWSLWKDLDRDGKKPGLQFYSEVVECL